MTMQLDENTLDKQFTPMDWLEEKQLELNER